MTTLNMINLKNFSRWRKKIWAATVETITWNAYKETLTETCALDVNKWKIVWIFIDYLGKKKNSISCLLLILNKTYYDSFLHFGKWQKKSQILDKPDYKFVYYTKM